MKLILLTITVLLLSNLLFSQDSIPVKKEKVKTGWNLGALPVVAFDSDIGVQYGALGNLYYYGNGSTYPKYLHSIYAEWSRTTKGGGINTMRFDSDSLIRNIRVFSEAGYFTEQALDFYGFNGAESEFNPSYITKNDSNYISRMYYRYARKYIKLRCDFQGKIIPKKLFWYAGLEYNNIRIESVDIERLNKGKEEEDKLPDTLSLYDKYVNWGIIPDNIKNGGTTPFVKLGLVYDTRDNEPNPMTGIWDEILVLVTAPFTEKSNYKYIT